MRDVAELSFQLCSSISELFRAGLPGNPARERSSVTGPDENLTTGQVARTVSFAVDDGIPSIHMLRSNGWLGDLGRWLEAEFFGGEGLTARMEQSGR